MLDAFFFIGLPYLAIMVAVVGTYWKWRTMAYTWSSRSSQFLEDRQLRWGSAPWHIGVGVVLLGHLLALLFPGVWTSVLAVPLALALVEILGAAAAFMAIVGLVVLLARRVTSARVQAVTTPADLLVLVLLLGQCVLGLATAAQYR